MDEKYIAIIEEQKKQIDDLNRQLSKCEATRTHFISNIRNEIINPFASIHGLAKLIINDQNQDWKNVASIASMIHKESFMLDFQLANIFSAAEIESGLSPVNLYNSNISELFKTEIENFDLYAQKRNIKIDLTNKAEENFVVTDIAKIKLILVNLLMNAINFSNDNSEIIVDYKITEDVFSLSVKDFGIGLSIEDQEKIFNRFSKANNEINSINIGLGLGLSVIASHLELLEGAIEIDSELDKGSTFKVNIPIHSVESENLDMANSENEFFFDNELF
jgi:signal transduction histidine kinase